MKAVKLSKINWNLDSVKKEDREKVLATLPKFKGFMAADDFNVIEKVPALLEKKYGYSVFTYSYVELRVVDNVEDPQAFSHHLAFPPYFFASALSSRRACVRLR